MTHRNPAAEDDGNNAYGGLVAVILVIVIVLFAGGYLLWMQSPIWFAGFAQDGFEEALSSSSIAESEQSELVEVVDQLAERIEDRTIGWFDMPEIIQSISESEFAPIALSLYLQATAVHPLDLSNEDKARSHLTILRLEWAVQNNAIPEDELDPLWKMLGNSSNDNDSGWFEKEIVLTEQQLLEFLSQAEPLLAEYEIPLQPYDFDLSDSLQTALERFLIPD